MNLEGMSMKDLNERGGYLMRCAADYPAYRRYKGNKAKSLDRLNKEVQAITEEMARQKRVNLPDPSQA